MYKALGSHPSTTYKHNRLRKEIETQYVAWLHMNTGKNLGTKESEKHTFDLETVRELSLPWALGLHPVEIISDFGL